MVSDGDILSLFTNLEFRPALSVAHLVTFLWKIEAANCKIIWDRKQNQGVFIDVWDIAGVEECESSSGD